MFSILHISDLHRFPAEPVDNDALIAALLADRDRYLAETPIVPSPDAIIVSGDLIQGASIDCPDWQKSIEEQYSVARTFFDRLINRFLNGDRSKLIIVPGNHDICWNTSFTSMELVPESEYQRMLGKFWSKVIAIIGGRGRSDLSTAFEMLTDMIDV